MRLTRIVVAFAALGSIALLTAGGQDGARFDQQLRGFVTPSREVELSAPLEDILRNIAVEESDRVDAGQLLAQMDDGLQKEVVAAARVRAESKAEVDRAVADLEDTNITLERLSSAFDRNAANDLELRRARIDVQIAEAGLTTARENHVLSQVNLRLEEQRLERYQIRAPFAGTIIEIFTEDGAMITLEEPVIKLAHLDTLEAHINLPIEMFGDLSVGEKYTLAADVPVNRDVEGTLKTINPIIDTASRTFRCVFTIDNPGAKLPAGFTIYLKWGS